MFESVYFTISNAYLALFFYLQSYKSISQYGMSVYFFLQITVKTEHKLEPWDRLLATRLSTELGLKCGIITKCLY